MGSLIVVRTVLPRMTPLSPSRFISRISGKTAGINLDGDSAGSVLGEPGAYGNVRNGMGAGGDGEAEKDEEGEK